MIRRTSLRKPSYRAYKKPLILIGVRQNIADIVSLAESNNYQVIGILDQYYFGNTESFSNIPIIGDERWLLDDSNSLAQKWINTTWFICSSWWTGRQYLNNNGLDLEKIRKDRINILNISQVKLANLIHPDVKIPGIKTVSLGTGIIIMGEALIGSYSTIGNHSFIDWQASISKYTKIGQGCIIGGRTNIANYEIGNYVRIGVGANLVGSKKDHSFSKIGENSIIHVGAVAVDDIPPNHIRTFTNKTLPRTSHETN